jgi:hexosaminidase
MTPSHGKKRKSNDPYGGYYTKAQIKELLQYANDRFITVIPEIEMPGHCTDVLASYPEYSCTGIYYLNK